MPISDNDENVLSEASILLISEEDNIKDGEPILEHSEPAPTRKYPPHLRMQNVANTGKYKNTLDCVLKIVREEGPLAFFKGLESTIWRHAAWNGGYFGVIHGVKASLPKAETSGEKLTNNFIAGSIGGTFGTMLNTPFDVVKTRVQNQHSATVPKYNWTWSALGIIVREEG